MIRAESARSTVQRKCKYRRMGIKAFKGIVCNTATAEGEVIDNAGPLTNWRKQRVPALDRVEQAQAYNKYAIKR